ncbi:hypothetical protein QFC24_000045 [Naganishia onofrii]|uniref:Uncharacterized protein n=1 Tax=Naganishia onofrii TaxID=1851511 RepID=A0ACC2XUT1_9TREE|nr:hypothetical protein QFC24_000045 [Naganishia onofrii]
MSQSTANSTRTSVTPADTAAHVPTSRTEGSRGVKSTVNGQSGGGESFNTGEGPEEQSDMMTNASQTGIGTVPKAINNHHQQHRRIRNNPEELDQFTKLVKNGSVSPYQEGEDLDLHKILANAKMVSSTIKAGLASPVVPSPQLITSATAIAGTSSNNGVSRGELKWLLPISLCSGIGPILTLILMVVKYRRHRRHRNEDRDARELEVLMMLMNPLSAPAQPGDGGASIGSGNNVLQTTSAYLSTLGDPARKQMRGLGRDED